VEQCFSLTANQPQPAYKKKNSLPNRANEDTFQGYTNRLQDCYQCTKIGVEQSLQMQK
jgi:hypothetical protein